MARAKTLTFSDSALELLASPAWKKGKVSTYVSALVEASHREWQVARHTLHVLDWTDAQIARAVLALNGHVLSPVTTLGDELAAVLGPELGTKVRDSEPAARALYLITRQYWLGCEPLRQALKSAVDG